MAVVQHSIGRLDAVHPTRTDLGVCVAPLLPTGGCMDRARTGELIRADFNVLILCSGGSGDQVVDLGTHHHEAGSLLWLRPGRVHEKPPAVQGTVVCFTDAFVGAEPALRAETSSWILGPDDLGDIRAHLAVLEGEYQRYVFGPTGPHLVRGEAMLNLLLRALLLRVAQAPGLRPRLEPGPVLRTHPVAEAFLALVERSYASIHTVGAYATVLGYSAKTLERASIEATGFNPKQVIDARLVLEARLLLSHTNLPVSAVGRRLGFVDPANFCKFFLRAGEMSPGAFRSSLRH